MTVTVTSDQVDVQELVHFAALGAGVVFCAQVFFLRSWRLTKLRCPHEDFLAMRLPGHGHGHGHGIGLPACCSCAADSVSYCVSGLGRYEYWLFFPLVLI